MRIVSPTCEAEARRQARRQDRGAARVEARASAAARSPSTTVRRPSARKSAPTIAAASTRMPRKARSNEAIGRHARDAGDGGERLLDLLVGADRADRS